MSRESEDDRAEHDIDGPRDERIMLLVYFKA